MSELENGHQNDMMAVSVSLHESEVIVKARRRSLLVVRRLVMLVLLAVAWLRVLASSEPPAPPEEEAELRTATELFRRAASHRINGEIFVRGTRALVPWLDRLGGGLSSLVLVNVRKLEVAGVLDLEPVLATERRDGRFEKDDSATTATLWNGRVLGFIARFLDEILEADSLNTDLSLAARAAYKATLERHHPLYVRTAARAILSRLPDARTLFENRLGYPPDTWDTRLRADLDSLKTALDTFLIALKAALQRHDHVL
ncbi:hypothetical protein CTAYLR_009568 [Chrysophaeum taylorii]|uniref:Glycolipid transfer protein domain-containing protein n=1 Tax=Chrysophaeum taylorii TaxID=2483200 RepID=A0AAD7XRA4_9STRA|nr:hypothetical protein CTAYLR_009568 [Chrysophaeum taylorii]